MPFRPFSRGPSTSPGDTGSGLRVVLKESGRSDPADVLDHVSRAFAERFDLRWLPPLGFENTYAISVRTEMAERLGCAP